MNVMSAGLTLRAVVGMVIVIIGLSMTSSVIGDALLEGMQNVRLGWTGR
jgi:hypothetical protein